MSQHKCQLTGMKGEYLYLCSRCKTCYACKHKAVQFEVGTWMWKCKDGKFRELILDGRLYER